MVPRVDGSDEQVADQAEQKQADHEIHREVIGLRLRDALFDSVRRNVVDELRAKNGGHGP